MFAVLVPGLSAPSSAMPVPISGSFALLSLSAIPRPELYLSLFLI